MQDMKELVSAAKSLKEECRKHKVISARLDIGPATIHLDSPEFHEAFEGHEVTVEDAGLEYWHKSIVFDGVVFFCLEKRARNAPRVVVL